MHIECLSLTGRDCISTAGEYSSLMSLDFWGSRHKYCLPLPLSPQFRESFSFSFSDHLSAQMLGGWGRLLFGEMVFLHRCTPPNMRVLLPNLATTPPESMALTAFPPLHPWTHHCLGQQGRRCRDTCKTNSNRQHGFCLAFLPSQPGYWTSYFQEAQAPRRDITWVFEPKASKSQRRSTALPENGHQGVSTFTMEISQWRPQTPWVRDKTFAACSTSCPTGSKRRDKRGLFQAAELGVLLDISQ